MFLKSDILSIFSFNTQLLFCNIFSFQTYFLLGKRRRITLIECNNDVNSMLDLAKVADLVLLLIDASFGFEMEIFEFLNICQVNNHVQNMYIDSLTLDL